MMWFWQHILYDPLVNTLILLYNTIALNNLGLAIVYLTILTRIVTLPLSLQNEKNLRIQREVGRRIKDINRDYGSDEVGKREEIKRLLKAKGIKRWTKGALLLIQILILVLLYQVFIAGTEAKALAIHLYRWVDIPLKIDTTFLGWFDVAERNFLISAICGLILVFNIYNEQRQRTDLNKGRDLTYLIAFPFATFLTLWYLPSAKAVFILTSLIFSMAIHGVFPKKKPDESKSPKAPVVAASSAPKKSTPTVRDRFK